MISEEYSSLDLCRFGSTSERGSAPDNLNLIEGLVKEVINGKGSHFDVVGYGKNKARLHMSLTGKGLFKSLADFSDPDVLDKYVDWFEANPYLSLYVGCLIVINFEAGWDVKTGVFSDVSRAADILNGAVDSIRREAKGRLFKRRVRRLQRAEEKRHQSLIEYIYSLHECRSRLLILRVDLGYRQGMYIDSFDFVEDLRAAKADWQALRADLRRGIPLGGLLGFSTKMEYGILSGFHFHVLLFFDGAQYRRDVSIAKLIGEHWVNQITQGQGRYFNCNANKEKYRKSGIGVVEYDDNEKIDNLENIVARYLAKPDYYIQSKAPGERTFFRGGKPEIPQRTLGRPRRQRSISSALM